MRYLYLAALLAAIAAGGAVLEFVFTVTGGALSIYRKSGAGLPILYLMALVFTAAFMKAASPAGPGAYLRTYFDGWRTAWRGFLAFFCATSAIVACSYPILAAIGQLGWREDAAERIEAALAFKLLSGTVVGCLLAVTEEALFRGFVMRYLRWRPSAAVTVSAVVVSSLVFALVHNIEHPLAWFTAEELPLFVGLTILGMALATTYLATGSIACAVGLHAGLIVAGEVFLRAKLVRVDFEPWWMGAGSGDIRTAPITWLLFAAIAVAVFAARHGLHRRFAVERSFVGIAAADTIAAAPSKTVLAEGAGSQGNARPS